MKQFGTLSLLAMAGILLPSLMGFRYHDLGQGNPSGNLVFPYSKMGLTPREAAAHLLSRFTFGPTPGQVEQVVNRGLENWFLQQLEGGLPDTGMERRLSKYDLLNLSNTQMVNTFLRPGELLRAAQEYGIPIKDSADADEQVATVGRQGQRKCGRSQALERRQGSGVRAAIVTDRHGHVVAAMLTLAADHVRDPPGRGVVEHQCLDDALEDDCREVRNDPGQPRTGYEDAVHVVSSQYLGKRPSTVNRV